MDDEKTRKPANDPRVLLRLSEHFLRRRHLNDCRNHAHQIDPNFPGVSQILAVADVLLASDHPSPSASIARNWYDVLQLDRFTGDSDLISQQFNRLYGLLNPSNNKLPFADEAFDAVCDAWYVLSSPVKKLEFDGLLKRVLDAEESKVDDVDCVFWTACPYCYYLYEFPRVYVELCLRCPNDKCCRAFTCVEIDRPPVEVLEEGKYVCDGFLPLGYQSRCWNPFAPLSEKKARCSDGNDNFITISDDDDDDEKEEEEEDDDDDNGSGGVEANGDESLNGDAGGLKTEVDMQPRKASFGRKKSVVKKAKKVTGAGSRVRKEACVHPERTDGCEFF